jgi:hypothetical protein
MTRGARLILLLGSCAVCSALGAEGDDAQEVARRDEVARLAPAKAKQVEMLVGETQIKATLRSEPLLRWSNPTAGSVHGEVFLWTQERRPVAIASIYRWYHPYKDSTFEVVSTTTSRVIANEDKKLLWEAKGNSIEWRALTDAAVPEKPTASAMLNAMRQLARRFSARLVDQRVGGEAVERELRLLNQPAYRYACPEANVVDGGLFALVEVTDPEVWILLEAVKRDDKTVWQYALARMNADACEVRLDDKIVQRWERIIEPWRINKAPYTLFGFKAESVKLDESKE